MAEATAEDLSSSQRKNPFNYKRFYALLLTGLLGFFLFVSYYASQQSQVYESSAIETSCNSINKLDLTQAKKRDRCAKNSKCKWSGTIRNGRCIVKPVKSGTCSAKKIATCKAQGRSSCKNGKCIGCNAAKCKSLGKKCNAAGNCVKKKSSSSGVGSGPGGESSTINAIDVIAGRIKAKPGDKISDYGIGAIVPKPGISVTAVLDASASEDYPIGQTITVTTSLDGIVTVDKVGDETARARVLYKSAQAANAPNIDECEDDFGEDLGYSWDAKLNWHLNTNSIPSYLDTDEVLSDIRDAHLNLTQENNNCDRQDELDELTTEYKGTTTKIANMGVVNDEAVCYEPDEQNTIDFGVLSEGTVGLNCSWSKRRLYQNRRNAYESDIRLNKAVYKFTTNNECKKSRYNIEGVVTHELGHSFGLGDIYDDGNGHKELTMGWGAPYGCGKQAGGSTLGLGDMLLLEAEY